jgi:hypothetical protein
LVLIPCLGLDDGETAYAATSQVERSAAREL